MELHKSGGGKSISENKINETIMKGGIGRVMVGGVSMPNGAQVPLVPIPLLCIFPNGN